MLFGIIFTRLLYIACMVFIIGYVFGNFSKSRILTRLTRVASILAIVLFLAGNVFLFRLGAWRQGQWRHTQAKNCVWENKDSVYNR